MNFIPLIIGGVFALISAFVSKRLKSKFAHYSKVHLQNGLTGAQIAQKMLRDNGISDVQVISTPGQLTDHYDPRNKTVNLSEVVYGHANAAAAAVAAHECGHAIQHAQAYSWLTMRSKLVPAVGFASKYLSFVIMAGFAIVAFTDSYFVLMIGIALFSATTLFSFVTLPVEFDASSRALKWLERENMVTENEHAGAKDALKWAALTYVVAALGSLANLVYYISLLNRRR